MRSGNELPLGTVLAGYRVESLVGRGGMGSVYRATQLKLERVVALKVIGGQVAEDAGFRERFKRESLVTASVEHPNVIPVIEADEDEDCLFISMRYVDGSDLAREIRTRGPLPGDLAIGIVSQVAAGLSAAHERGLVHRDVKPANVLLAGQAGRPHVYVTDFGIARRTCDPGLTATGVVLGTLDYMPPEQLRGEIVDARADVYALGCLLYEALAATVPFPRAGVAARIAAHLYQSPPRITDIRPDLGAALDDVICTALAKKPSERFASTIELAQAARSALASHASAAGTSSGACAPVPAVGLARQNFPVHPARLIGREREVSEIGELLARDEVRLLSLVGPSGTGKTRLAVEAAAHAAREIDIVSFVNLAPLSDANLVVPTIAQALSVKEHGSQDVLDSLCAHIGGDEMLLVLDNFEQVADAAPAIAELLSRIRQLKVMVTSRAPLHVSGEYQYAVPPLTDDEAIALFAERARMVNSRLTLDDRAVVTAICHRLDCLPLAIELAAARVKLLSTEALLERLGERLTLLTGGPRDHEERQRTLRAAIDWSHELLSAQEQRLFRRLAVFAGGRTLEAIERVCDPDNDLDVFEAVASLVDKSLLGRMDSSDASPRFVMLETIQEYAAERLAESGERDRFRRLHADFFLELAERGERELRGADQQRWRGILALEHDNLRSAMEWSLDGDGGRLALAIASRLWRLWLARGDLTEGRRWLEAAIGSAPTDAPRALALRGLAALALEQGDLGRSEETARQALSLDRESGDAHGELHSIGMVADCLAIRGDLAAARELYAQAEELARVLGDDRQYAANLYYLGELARLTGDLDAANARLTEALALFARLQDSLGHGATARALAEVALERGDLDWAFSLLDDAAALSLAAGYVSGLLAIIDAYARLFAKAGQPAAAATLWGAFGQVREDLGRHLDQPHEAAVREATTSSIRAALGEAAFRAAVDFGASMSLEQAVAWAREERAMDTRSSGRFLDQ